MICIQETKLQYLQDSNCYNLWGHNNINWVNKQATRKSGGVLTIWNKEKNKCEKQVVGNMYIGVIGQFYTNVNANSILVSTFNVYSSCVLNEKLNLWEELASIKLREECKQWCMLGDFNVVGELMKEEAKIINEAQLEKWKDLIISLKRQSF